MIVRLTREQFEALLAAELAIMIEQETPFLLYRTDETDSGSAQAPRFKLVQKEGDLFGHRRVSYMEIAFTEDGRLDERITNLLKNWEISVIVVQRTHPRRASGPGSRVRVVRAPYQTFDNGIHKSEPLAGRKDWGIGETACTALESLIDRYQPT